VAAFAAGDTLGWGLRRFAQRHKPVILARAIGEQARKCQQKHCNEKAARHDDQTLNLPYGCDLIFQYIPYPTTFAIGVAILIQKIQ
jgi:hypothetical protein